MDPAIPLETESHLSDLYNALTGAIQIFYWTGEGQSSHPEQATGLFGLSGEINYVEINGRVVHERRAPKEYNLVLVPDIDFETGSFSSPALSDADLVDALASAASNDFYVEVGFPELLSLRFYLSPNCGSRDSQFDVNIGEQDLSAKIKLQGRFKIPMKSSAVGSVQSLGKKTGLVPVLVVFRKLDESTKNWVRAKAPIAGDSEPGEATRYRIANWKMEGR